MGETFDFLDVPDELAAALAAQPDATRKRKDPTEPRTFQTWYHLPVQLDGQCSNPDCFDPRPPSDAGRNVVTRLPAFSTPTEPMTVCRWCFLAGYPKQDWREQIPTLLAMQRDADK